MLESPGNLLRISVPRLHSRLIKSERQDLKDSGGPSGQLSVQRASELEPCLQVVTPSLMQELSGEELSHLTSWLITWLASYKTRAAITQHHKLDA